MILKLKQGTTWLFIDGVKECVISETPNEKEGEMEGFELHFNVGTEHLTLFRTETTYLLNNDGKTIERLVL